MKPEFKEAVKLHKQGHTAEEISDEIGVSRATAYRWIETYKGSLALAGSNGEYEEEELEETHAEDSALDQPSLSGIEKANELKERELSIIERRDFVEKEKTKRSILKEFKSLLSGIKEYASGFRWGHKEVSDVALKVEELEESLQEVFEFDDNEMCHNSACQIVGILKDEFNHLVDSGAEYSFRFDWSHEKLNMLDFGLSIGSLDNNEFDLENYVRQGAWNRFVKFTDGLRSRSGESVSNSDVSVIQKSVGDLIERLSVDDSGIEGEFDEELALLEDIKHYLEELAVRISENIWRSKRFVLPEEISEKIDELIENNQGE